MEYEIRCDEQERRLIGALRQLPDEERVIILTEWMQEAERIAEQHQQELEREFVETVKQLDEEHLAELVTILRQLKHDQDQRQKQ